MRSFSFSHIMRPRISACARCTTMDSASRLLIEKFFHIASAINNTNNGYSIFVDAVNDNVISINDASRASRLKPESGDSLKSRILIHRMRRWIMGKSYSSDLRSRVAGFVDAGHSRRQAARHFGVSPSFAVKLALRRRKTGSYAPRQAGSPGRRWQAWTASRVFDRTR